MDNPSHSEVTLTKARLERQMEDQGKRALSGIRQDPFPLTVPILRPCKTGGENWEDLLVSWLLGGDEGAIAAEGR